MADVKSDKLIDLEKDDASMEEIAALRADYAVRIARNRLLAK
jgi:hypothetical protein